MPIPNAKHKILSKVLEENKELLQEIEGWFDASEAKVKVQKANDEITQERDELKNELKGFKEKVDGFEKTNKEKDAEIERLQKNMLTDDDKAKFDEFKKSGVSSDAQKEFDAKVNKLNDTVSELMGKFEASEAARAESEKRLAETEFSKQQTELDNKLTTAFASKKITGKNTDLALLLVKNKKLAELKKNDDGSVAEKYFVVGDDKQFRDATIDELAEYVAVNHENLVESSGNGGGGLNHQTPPPNGGGSTPAQLHDIRNSARAMLEMDK